MNPQSNPSPVSARALGALVASLLLALGAVPARVEAQSACTASTPVQFEPNQPGVSRPASLSPGSSALTFYRSATGAPRLMNAETFGYSVLDISNPASPRALKYDDFRVDPNTATTNTVAQHGDGQSYVATTAVSPDGQRIAFSMNGPGEQWYTLAGRSDGGEGFGMWGSFPPKAAFSTVVQAAGGRYIAYAAASSAITVADITSLPSAPLSPYDTCVGASCQAYEMSANMPGGYSMVLVGNYIVYVASSGVLTVFDASNPGPAGSIASGFKSASIPYLSTDPSHRAPANYTAALDPGDSTKLWILIEVSKNYPSESSPSYGLVSVTKDGSGNLTVNASPGLFRVPAQAGESWSNAGNASSLFSLNGVLFVVMWAQRGAPGTQYGFYATTAATWPTAGTFQQVAASNFNLPATSAVSYAPGGTAAYQYFPTGPRAFVVPLTCAPVNPKAASVITATAYGVTVPNNGTVWIGDKVDVTPSVVPAPTPQQPLTDWGWNIDIDFHSGASVEDAGATPRIKQPDNGVLLGVGQPPNPFTVYGPCDPAVLTVPGGVSPGSGAGCWPSVISNGAFTVSGSPDFSPTVPPTPGSTTPLTMAMEANNQYGTTGTTLFTINWKVPAAKVASTQILTGAPLVSTSDGHPAATGGYKWYFGTSATGLGRQLGCDGLASCPPSDQTSTFYWLTAAYTNGFSTPDYNGTTVVGLPFKITPFVPSFTVNTSATGPVSALINSNLALVNNSLRGSGITTTYQYSLCGTTVPCTDNYVAFSIPDSSGASGSITLPATKGTYALKIRANYTGGSTGTLYWPASLDGSAYFTINAVDQPIVTASASPNPAYGGDSVAFTCSAVGGSGSYTYNWSGQFGTVSSQPNFNLTAQNSGSSDANQLYTCTVTDTLSTQGSANVSLLIHPSPKPNVTAWVTPTSVVGGNPATFSCSATGGSGQYTYQWSGTFGTVSQQSSYTFTPTNTSGSTIYQQLTCTVTDSASQSSSANATLTITSSTSGPPSGGSLTVSASANPNPVQGGHPSTFSCSASGGSGNYSYQWSGSLGNFSTQNPYTFQASNNGSVNQSTLITCTATDNSTQKSGAANFTITVTPAGPTGPTCPSVDFAVYTSSGTRLQAGTTPFGVTIPMSASLGDLLAFSITSGSSSQFDWNFGDGSAHTTGNYAQHAYNAGGSFTVTLRPMYSDNSAFCGGTSYQISVAGPAGQFSAAYEDGTPITYSKVTAYKNIVFTALDSAGLVDAGSYAWDFGDGGTAQGSSTAVHPYAPGTFTARLTVTKNGLPVTTTLALTVPAPPEPPKWVVPGMAYVPGQVAGATWQSDVTIMNPSPLSAKYAVTFLDARAPITDYAQLSWIPFTIGPLASIGTDNVLGAIFGQQLGAYGALMIRGDQAPLPPVITARTFNNGDPAKGTFGLSVPQSSVSAGVSTQAAPAASVLVGLRQNDAAYTNIGLVNLHNDWATVEMDFYDGASSTDLGTLTVQINPYQSYQINKALQDGRFVPAAGYTPSSNLYSVLVKVREGTGVYPYATVIDLGTTDPIVVTPTAAPSNAYRIPGIVRLAGANGEQWRSRVTVANPSTASRKVHMVFSYQACNASGCSSLNSTAGDVNFAPGATQSWEDFVNIWLTNKGFITVSDGTSYQNSFLDVSPGDTNSDPLVVLGETYNATPVGHVGLQIPGYTPQDGASHSGAYKRLVLSGLAQSSTYRTNLALVALGGTSGKWATVHVVSAEGTNLQNIPVSVDGVSQLSAGTLFAGLSGDLSRVSIVVDNMDDGMTIGAYATIIDNVSGDATFVKATPVP